MKEKLKTWEYGNNVSFIMWEKDETIAILTMTTKENRQNLVFSDKFNVMLDEIIEDKSVTV